MYCAAVSTFHCSFRAELWSCIVALSVHEQRKVDAMFFLLINIYFHKGSIINEFNYTSVTGIALVAAYSNSELVAFTDSASKFKLDVVFLLTSMG